MTSEQQLKHIVRNATGGIGGLIKMYCKGCRLDDGRSVPELIQKHLIEIEQAVIDYVSGEKPRSAKPTPYPR